MKVGAGGKKGTAYERSVCRELSLWWSGGTNDAIFYKNQTGAIDRAIGSILRDLFRLTRNR